mmetsp:Transcript_4528/g.11596  ORF Transcript_4528/g.11596 Transcript_4528/m.11596 type:complete len:237 (-) Transcript_4528:67-777(-)
MISFTPTALSILFSPRAEGGLTGSGLCGDPSSSFRGTTGDGTPRTDGGVEACTVARMKASCSNDRKSLSPSGRRGTISGDVGTSLGEVGLCDMGCGALAWPFITGDMKWCVVEPVVIIPPLSSISGGGGGAPSGLYMSYISRRRFSSASPPTIISVSILSRAAPLGAPNASPSGANTVTSRSGVRATAHCNFQSQRLFPAHSTVDGGSQHAHTQRAAPSPGSSSDRTAAADSALAV